MAKVYAIISGKGGVGKTTTTINLGTSLNSLGEDVIIIDGNLTTPNVGIHLGAPIVPVTLNHVLSGQAKLEDAIYEHESGTKIIPASLSLKETERVDYRKIIDIIRKLKKLTNHVLIDSAAGLGEEARSVMQACDEVIIVTNPEMAAVTDALKTIKLAEEMHKPVKGVIITRYRGVRTEMPIANIHDMLETSILGIIPEDEAVKISQVLKNAVVHTHPKSKAARHYIETSKRLLGDDYKEPIIKRGFWAKLFRLR
ncbi:MAG: cell division ATPase MinD [Candidatus Nanoarchaeia archaeon]|nr:cell division ATPase MinD [Candidatus Nanoarchaeia archaeon]MDD5740377.1 cell division ATPase MinD [Candidatus Nanoarchaeia archaeon]